ncbi:S49 family peptidase [Phenylobacterium sp.]|jgi:signal peptide peptidase SppA|uniref:S49 family peptidase n=1 Tax=Phenylobacterium sp. TaxID=1871053 RepID=UPI002F42E92B
MPDLSTLLSTAAAQLLLGLYASGERLFAIDEDRLGHLAKAEAQARGPSHIAILPLHGALAARGSGSMETFRNRLSAAAANPEIGAIVIDGDSPGGTVAGTAETGAAVKAAAQVKPVVALADTLVASAAYWICSQASQIWMTPSAEVGSIGVIGVHFDVSSLLETNGIKPTLIKAGKFKAELTPFEPLTPEARDNVQAQADASHADFIRAVAEGRKTSIANVADNYGQGRVLGANRALDLGMVDRIGSMADVLASLRTSTGTVRRRMARRTSLAFA